MYPSFISPLALIAATLLSSINALSVSRAICRSTITARSSSISLRAPLAPRPTREWYESRGGHYKIQIPDGYDVMRDTIMKIQTDAGILDMMTSMTQHGENEVMMTAYIDYGEAAFGSGIPAMLDGAENGAMKNLHGNVIRRRKIVMDGNPGRSIICHGISGSVRVFGRIDYFIVKPRLYQILYLSDNPNGSNQKDVNEFFASFQLIPTTYESTEGRFTIQIPGGFGPVTLTDIPVDSTDASMHEVIASALRGTDDMLTINYIDFTENTLRDGAGALLDRLQRDAGRKPAHIKSSREIALDGIPGRSILSTKKFQNRTVYQRSDYYIAGLRGYQIEFSSFHEDAVTSPSVSAAFASFKLTR